MQAVSIDLGPVLVRHGHHHFVPSLDDLHIFALDSKIVLMDLVVNDTVARKGGFVFSQGKDSDVNVPGLLLHSVEAEEG